MPDAFTVPKSRHGEVAREAGTGDTDDRSGWPSRRRGDTLIALMVAAGLMTGSAAALASGTMRRAARHGVGHQIGTEQSERSTQPHGAVFLSDNNGGHWWITDARLGICELVPQNIPNQPPFLLNFCDATAVAGGQVVVGNPSPALALAEGSKFVYIADRSTGTSVARMVFSPGANAGNGGFTGSTVLNIANVNGARNSDVVEPAIPIGLALLPHLGVAANGGTQDLYVSYQKSGDIARIEGIDNVALIHPNPVVDIVGRTSDGIGTNSLLAFGPDLYVAETGGFGMSVIQDPSGISRTPCSPASVCAVISLGPSPSTFPGGLATDWVPGTSTASKSIFIGDTSRAGGQHSILRYDPATGSAITYSLNIYPTYNEPGGTGTPTTWTTYVNPLGLGYNAATGDLLVADDPQGMAAIPVIQQGHTWKLTVPGNPPVVTSIAPTVGCVLGGNVVTISGFNLAGYNAITGGVITNPTVFFGSKAGLNVSCSPAPAPPVLATPSLCTVTSPAGFGVVDVRVAIADQSSAAVPGDQFTYISACQMTASVTSVTPSSGATIGGTLVTITGNYLANYDGTTGSVITLPSINFGAKAATSITCQPTAVPLVFPVASVCTAISPPGAAGTVDVQASLADANGIVQTSPTNPGDLFTYFEAAASLIKAGLR